MLTSIQSQDEYYHRRAIEFGIRRVEAEIREEQRRKDFYKLFIYTPQPNQMIDSSRCPETPRHIVPISDDIPQSQSKPRYTPSKVAL